MYYIVLFFIVASVLLPESVEVPALFKLVSVFSIAKKNSPVTENCRGVNIISLHSAVPLHHPQGYAGFI